MLDLIRQRSSSWLVKLAFGVIILVFVFWGVGSYNKSGPGVAATVNGTPILMRDFQMELHAREQQIRAMIPDLSPEDLKSFRLPEQTLQMMISRTLVEQEAKRIGMTVTPVELLKVISAIPAFHGEDGKFNQQAYERILTAQGRTPGEFEREMMRDLLMEKMQTHVTSAITVTPEEAYRRFAFQWEKRVMSYVLFDVEKYRDGITISDEALKSYYDVNQTQFAFPALTAVSYIEVTPATLAHTMTVTDAEVAEAFARGPVRYNLSQILLTLPDGADEAKEAEVKAQLEDIAKKIADGKDFAEAAREFSQDSSASAGGALGWVQSRQISEEILAALAGLKKGGVTAPVRTGAGLALLRIDGSDPDWSLSDAEIKAELSRIIGEEKAALALHDVQGQLEDLVAMGKPLSEIAEAVKVQVRNTAAVPREDLSSVLGLRRPEQVSLFGGPEGSLVENILETRDGFLVAEIREQKPAGVKPLDEVKELITEILTRREAERKAEEAARQAIAGFSDGLPEAFADKVVTTEAFGRQGDIPGLGFARGLVDAVFSAPLNVWLKEPFATPRGAVIAMPVESIPVSDEDWKNVEDRITASLQENMRNHLFSAFIADMGRNAKVQVSDPRILEQ